MSRHSRTQVVFRGRFHNSDLSDFLGTHRPDQGRPPLGHSHGAAGRCLPVGPPERGEGRQVRFRYHLGVSCALALLADSFWIRPLAAQLANAVPEIPLPFLENMSLGSKRHRPPGLCESRYHSLHYIPLAVRLQEDFSVQV